MQTHLSPTWEQGLSSPLRVPCISEYIHLNTAARREPWHIWFMHCSMFGDSWKKQGLLPSFAMCSLSRIPPPLSDVVSLQCNRNNPLFLGYSHILKAPWCPDTNTSTPCKWGGLYNLCLCERTLCQRTLPLCQLLGEGHKKHICKNNLSVYPCKLFTEAS